MDTNRSSSRRGGFRDVGQLPKCDEQSLHLNWLDVTILIFKTVTQCKTQTLLLMIVII